MVRNQSNPVSSAKEMWTMGVFSICLLFILKLITPAILHGNYTLNFFGIESYRHNAEFGTKVGWEAIVGFLLVLPTIAAGLTYYRSRK